MENSKFIIGAVCVIVTFIAIGQIPSTPITYSAPSESVVEKNATPATEILLHVPEDIPETNILEVPPPFSEIEREVSQKSEVSPEMGEVEMPETSVEQTVAGAHIFSVPFYSQLTDITAPEWKKIGCGIASLAMLIEFHKPNTLTSVDALLQEGIDADAYTNAGWTYSGLIELSRKYGLDGTTHDLGGESMDVAFSAFEKALRSGPVMASVHYTFTPTNPIPHLVIVNGIDGDTLYYNDPAEPSGNGTVSIEQFKSAWKKRYIEFYKST